MSPPRNHNQRQGAEMLVWQIRRAFSTNVAAIAVLAALWLTAFGVGGYILAHQRIQVPSWVPVIGQHEFVIRAPIAGAAGVLPGQGQAVTIAGVTVGTIAAVDLEHGNAVLRLRIDDKYAHRIYPNATVLLRPKTGLKDMIAELDPGSSSAGKPLANNAELSVAQSQPTVDFDEVLRVLDTDTRQELSLLIGNGGQALGSGGGKDLASTFRRLQPLSRDVAQATELVSVRHAKLRRLMGNLSLLAQELGHRDRDLAGFVQSSEGVFRRFAAQNASLDQTVQLLPGALSSSNRALGKVQTLSNTLGSTSRQLDPTARALAPALRQIQPFSRATTPILRDSLRPFARAAIPTAKLLVPATRNFAAATPNLRVLADVLNAILDELAYDPPGNGVGQQSTLFYVPWASHDTNSLAANSDGIGPLQRGMVALSCGQLNLANSLTTVPKGHTEPRNPTLATLIQLLHPPDYQQLIDQGKCPKPETGK